MNGGIEAIYRTHRDGLFSLALSVTGRTDAAEDAVHDAVVRLCRSDKSVSGDPVAYVFAAVRNAAIDRRRKAGPRAAGTVSLVDVAELADESADPVEARETAERVSASLAGLPADQREAVVLHVYAGLTFAQAAQAVGVPLQTLASRYRRGLAGLRDRLTAMK